MFDDEINVKKTADFPRNLDGLSVAELRDYIAALQAEITRVEGDIAKKQAASDAAGAFFKD